MRFTVIPHTPVRSRYDIILVRQTTKRYSHIYNILHCSHNTYLFKHHCILATRSKTIHFILDLTLKKVTVFFIIIKQHTFDKWVHLNIIVNDRWRHSLKFVHFNSDPNLRLTCRRVVGNGYQRQSHCNAFWIKLHMKINRKCKINMLKLLLTRTPINMCFITLWPDSLFLAFMMSAFKQNINIRARAPAKNSNCGAFVTNWLFTNQGSAFFQVYQWKWNIIPWSLIILASSY